MSQELNEVIRQIQSQKRAEANNPETPIPPMTHEVAVIASQKRMAFSEPPAAIKTDPLP